MKAVRSKRTRVPRQKRLRQSGGTQAKSATIDVNYEMTVDELLAELLRSIGIHG